MDRIVQNYYGNRNNQHYNRSNPNSNKHFCAVCRIEIAPSRTSVMFHESSAQHKEKMRQAIERSKNKDGKPHPANMALQMKQQRDLKMQEELKKIENAAMQQYEKFDTSIMGSIKPTTESSQFQIAPISRNQNRRDDLRGFDQDLGYQKPKKSHGGVGVYSLEDMRNEDKDPIWSAHYDEDAGEIYYYNRNTNKSQWDRPQNFDGYEIMAGKQAKHFGDEQSREDYERTFGLKFTKATAVEEDNPRQKLPEDQGVIGQWQDEASDEDYYKKHSIANLEPEKQHELQNLDKECKAKTAEEIELEQELDSDNQQYLSANSDSDDERIQAQLQLQRKKKDQLSILGKRIQKKPRGLQLVNATQKDIEKEQLHDMRKLIEKNAIDEDYKKDLYLPSENKTNDTLTTTDDTSQPKVSFGFKKRDVKANVKKRKAEVTDGETD